VGWSTAQLPTGSAWEDILLDAVSYATRTARWTVCRGGPAFGWWCSMWLLLSHPFGGLRVCKCRWVVVLSPLRGAPARC
jgi:hypothetical protein